MQHFTAVPGFRHGAIGGDKATLRVIKDGFKQQPTAVAIVGDIAWVAEVRLRGDDANKQGPWLIVPVALH